MDFYVFLDSLNNLNLTVSLGKKKRPPPVKNGSKTNLKH